VPRFIRGSGLLADASDEGPGLEAGTKAGMSRKTKEISEYDRPIQDLENPDDDVEIRQGQI
jgi:hypothetical protein